jgi:hypothetical protein
LSRQVGDLEPELFVDGCLHRWLGVADDVAQVAEAGDVVADVAFGELGAGLWWSWLAARARMAARGLDLADFRSPKVDDASVGYQPVSSCPTVYCTSAILEAVEPPGWRIAVPSLSPFPRLISFY